jgi:uncharacterized protein (PEP-CTERM system associated)
MGNTVKSPVFGQVSDQTSRSAGNLRQNLKRFLSAYLATMAVASYPAWSAKWEITPTLSAGEIYTDNVSLTNSTIKESDWITQIVPEIAVRAIGTGLKFNATYNPEILYYARGQRDDQVFQRGSAGGYAELAKQLLFVDFGANINQYDASLQGPVTTTNVNSTGNRASVRSYFVSPYLHRDIGSDVQAEARFTESTVTSDDSSLQSNEANSLSNSNSHRFDLFVRSGPTYKVLTWDITYNRENIDYATAQDLLLENVTASARRLITSTVGLLASVGYDHYTTDGFGVGPNSSGVSWMAGIEWTPSPTTRLSASAGHRFFGDAYALDFSHRTRLTTWNVVYTQKVTTSRSEFFVIPTSNTNGYLNTLFTTQFPDPAAREKAVQDYVARTGLPTTLGAPVNIFSNQLLLVKRLQASTGVLGAHNIVIANVFRETSEPLDNSAGSVSSGDFATNNNISQTGTSFVWNWRITPRDSWNLGGAYSRNEFTGTGRVDHLLYMGMGLTRQFQPKLYGSLNYRRQQDNSNASDGSYTENAIFATILKRF